ncbi:hypothetical protein [Nostoc sp. NMS8]|uniref:hypothetical protein n=1 Tax=Nostoc sp. NMS8 TaxID=2815392 RepID=UPI0025D39454|nr:hypothetical protein [Nostoc sp. NMS8]MBN3957443.1 hypothetical protein [Nostoc sp. NMS8]
MTCKFRYRNDIWHHCAKTGKLYSLGTDANLNAIKISCFEQMAYLHLSLLARISLFDGAEYC